MKKIFAFLIIAFFVDLNAQTLPAELYIDEAQHMLISGKINNYGGIYDSAHIAKVNITFKESNYWTLLTNNYANKVELPAIVKIDDQVFENVGIRFKGNTSYKGGPGGGTNNSQKKSFNITLDYLNKDQEIDGYSTLNLNNAFEDPTFMREVLYGRQCRRFIPSLKGNFVHLYLNDVDWGIYPNIQQVNKDFYKEWFKNNDGINWRADRPSGTSGGPGGGGQWGDGTAGLNYLGVDTATYKSYYTLKSSGIEQPWSKLVTLCNVLNNTSIANLPTELPKVLDVDKTLWFLACEIAFGDDDSYVFKGKMDYYIYYDEQTDQITPIEFDGNSAFGKEAQSWGPFYNESKVNYPLLNKMLKVPEWRQRYIAHMKTILEQALSPNSINPIIENYKTQIDALVNSDPKKATTYAAFTSGITTLKTWCATRYTNFKSNNEIKSENPIISEVSMKSKNGVWVSPFGGEFVTITLKSSSQSGLNKVNLYYDNGLWGNYQSIQMYDDGLHDDGTANDGLYGANIPGQETGTWVRFYIESIANNTQKSVSYSPVGAEHDVYIYHVAPKPLNGKTVVINELMAANNSIVTDKNGQYEDWIELYNTTASAIDLSGYYLTDDATNPDKWQFLANTIIPANGYMIIWADEDSAEDPIDHCNFKLSKSGEELLLLNPNLEIVDSLKFGEQISDLSYARSPNGTGSFVIKASTFNSNNDVSSAEENNLSSSFIIAPNPTTLGFKVLNTDGENLKICDIMGKFFIESNDYHEDFISTDSWLPGIYLIQIGVETQKLIVK